jgi:hypothetical protein
VDNFHLEVEFFFEADERDHDFWGKLGKTRGQCAFPFIFVLKD